ncbi:hypothetical protein [Archangium violaceum]|uniref:hypothetical protein n=1 Tax=Archangium violaceum TaxID=83451 RepID=UPI0023B26845|nr:hypothetical protein [Archangium violaceum]
MLHRTAYLFCLLLPFGLAGRAGARAADAQGVPAAMRREGLDRTAPHPAYEPTPPPPFPPAPLGRYAPGQ